MLPLIDAGGSAIYSRHVSPMQLLALLQQTVDVTIVQPRPDGASREVVEPRETFTLLERDGRPRLRLTLPDEQRLRSLAWDESGNAIPTLFAIGSGKPDIKEQSFRLNPQMGILRPLAKSPSVFPAAQPAGGGDSQAQPLRIVLSPNVAREGEPAVQVGLLWLESVSKSEKPRTLVCGDSAGGRLLPAGNGVQRQISRTLRRRSLAASAPSAAALSCMRMGA